MKTIKEVLDSGKCMVLDGAMATELEKMGYDLNDALWSAKVLNSSPEAIEKVHLDYLKAGAEILISSSYQATFEGFKRIGLTESEIAMLLKKSTDLGRSAIAQYAGEGVDHIPFIAASVGPYGAFLADGSEYRGNYGISDEALYDFHLKRFLVLEESAPDLYAFETIPCLQEAKVLAKLLSDHSKRNAWISFSCKDDMHISSGERIVDCARWLDACPQIIAVGINCTAPEYVSHLIHEIKKGTRKPIVVYPNLGEIYDPRTKQWMTITAHKTFVEYIPEWLEAGAQIIGGCCRTSPEDIARVAHLLEK